MLFNSYEFLLLFVPLTLLGYYSLAARGFISSALAWLVFASLVFYGWWNPAYLPLIGASILFNFAVGRQIANMAKNRPGRNARGLMVLGVAANLGALGYFKYANFFVKTASTLTPVDFHLSHIVLPLAISFFTFQQITYLVDTYKGDPAEPSLLRYSLFVTFFPQLIAGPIVHHKEMLPQFAEKGRIGFRHEYLAVGVTIFVFGLFKKVVIADNVAVYSTPLFDAAYNGF